MVPPLGFQPRKETVPKTVACSSLATPERHSIFSCQRFGSLSGIRTRTVQILSLLSPTNCTTRPNKQKIPDPYFRRDRGFQIVSSCLDVMNQPHP